MNPNDIIAHYAAERLSLMVELQQTKDRLKQAEEALAAMKEKQ